MDEIGQYITTKKRIKNAQIMHNVFVGTDVVQQGD